MVNPHVHMCTAASPEIITAVRVMKALRTPAWHLWKRCDGRRFLTNNPTRIPHPRGLFYFNTDCYACIIYTFRDKKTNKQKSAKHGH